MKEVRQLKDLKAEMRSHPDVGMALQVQNAIQAVISDRRNSISEESLLTRETLGEIRMKLYDVGHNPDDPLAAVLQCMMGKTANPTEAALQFIEKEIGLLR